MTITNLLGPDRDASSASVLLTTTRFGVLEVPVDQVFACPSGIPGFSELGGLAILPVDGDALFVWLHSTELADVAFLALNPWPFFVDYEIEIPDRFGRDLGIEEPADAVVFCLALSGPRSTSIPREPPGADRRLDPDAHDAPDHPRRRPSDGCAAVHARRLRDGAAEDPHPGRAPRRRGRTACDRRGDPTVSSFSISGISSGLDTSALVEGLMFAERQTVRRLEASQTRANDQIRAWNLISTRLEGAKSAIETLRSGGLGATTASSSNENLVRVATRSDAAVGTYQFRVDQLAAAQQVSSAGISSGAALTGAGVARFTSGIEQRDLTVRTDTFADGSHVIELVSRTGNDLTVRVNGETQTVTIRPNGRFTIDDGAGGELEFDAGPGVGGGDPLELGTLRMTKITTNATTTVAQLASSLNVAGGPVRAQVIDTGDGTATSHRLVLSARGTGVANVVDIDLGGLSLFSGGLTTIREASDARLTMGDGAITITRPTNSITDTIAGVTLDLVGSAPDTDVEITVGADLDARVANVKSFVDEVNRALSQVRTATTYNVETGTGAPLVGSSAARTISTRLTAAMGSVVPGGSLVLLGQIGITLGADGTYRLDEAKLSSALESDPEGVQRLLVGSPDDDTDGLADGVHAVLADLTRADGRIGTAVEGAEATIRDLRDSIAMQELRPRGDRAALHPSVHRDGDRPGAAAVAVGLPGQCPRRRGPGVVMTQPTRTDDDRRDREHRPSSWSAVLDSLAAQVDLQERCIRLGHAPPPDLDIEPPASPPFGNDRLRLLELFERCEALALDAARSLASTATRVPQRLCRRSGDRLDLDHLHPIMSERILRSPAISPVGSVADARRQRSAPPSTRPTNGASPRVGSGRRANWPSTPRCSPARSPTQTTDWSTRCAPNRPRRRHARRPRLRARRVVRRRRGDRDADAVRDGLVELLAQLEEPRAHTLHLHPDVVALLTETAGRRSRSGSRPSSRTRPSPPASCVSPPTAPPSNGCGDMPSSEYATRLPSPRSPRSDRPDERHPPPPAPPPFRFAECLDAASDRVPGTPHRRARDRGRPRPRGHRRSGLDRRRPQPGRGGRHPRRRGRDDAVRFGRGDRRRRRRRGERPATHPRRG